MTGFVRQLKKLIPRPQTGRQAEHTAGTGDVDPAGVYGGAPALRQLERAIGHQNIAQALLVLGELTGQIVTARVAVGSSLEVNPDIGWWHLNASGGAVTIALKAARVIPARQRVASNNKIRRNIWKTGLAIRWGAAGQTVNWPAGVQWYEGAPPDTSGVAAGQEGHFIFRYFAATNTWTGQVLGLAVGPEEEPTEDTQDRDGDGNPDPETGLPPRNGDDPGGDPDEPPEGGDPEKDPPEKAGNALFMFEANGGTYAISRDGGYSWSTAEGPWSDPVAAASYAGALAVAGESDQQIYYSTDGNSWAAVLDGSNTAPGNMANPGFDNGSTGWTLTNAAVVSDITRGGSAGALTNDGSSAASFTASQVIQIPASVLIAVTAGRVSARFRWYQRTGDPSAGDDPGRGIMEALNSSSATVATETGDLAAPTESGWVQREITLDLPATSTAVRVTLKGERALGSVADIHFEDTSLDWIISPTSTYPSEVALPVVNGDFESGTSPWTSPHGGAGLISDPHSGTYSYGWNANDGVSPKYVEQTINLPAEALAKVDTGAVVLNLEYWQNDQGTTSDESRNIVYFLNSSNSVISSSANSFQQCLTWIRRTRSITVPAGTAKVRLRFEGRYVSGGNYVNTKIDDVSGYLTLPPDQEDIDIDGGLVNGNFETGNLTGWSHSSTAVAAAVAQIGNYGLTTNGSASAQLYAQQTVNVPTTVRDALAAGFPVVATMRYFQYTHEPGRNNDPGFGQIRVTGGGNTETLSNPEISFHGYREVEISLHSWAEQIRVRLESNRVVGGSPSITFDEVSLTYTVTQPPGGGGGGEAILDDVRALAVMGGIWIAGLNNGGAMKSANGTSWAGIDHGLDGNITLAATAQNSKAATAFLLGNSEGDLVYSADAESWGAVQETGVSNPRVAWGKTAVLLFNPAANALQISATNGASFSAGTSAGIAAFYAWDSGREVFVAVGSASSGVYYSANGSSWTNMSSTAPAGVSSWAGVLPTGTGVWLAWEAGAGSFWWTDDLGASWNESSDLSSLTVGQIIRMFSR